MFRNKITRKLTLLVATSLVLLIGIVIAAQFLIISRNYMTTEYNQERVSRLFKDIYPLIKRYQTAQGDSNQILSALNDYARENRCCCLILNKSYEIEQTSYNIDMLNRSYLDYVQKWFRSGQHDTNLDQTYANSDQIFPNSHQIFQILNFFHMPTRYIGIYYPIYIANEETGLQEKSTFVAITKEVYINENYTILMKYSGYLFGIIAIVAIVLSIVFSRLVTRPVLKIRDAAAHMIGMDFTQKCDYKAHDELGDLASSINYLAEKLNEAIKQLNEANGKLQSDLNAQLEIDRMRKSFIASASHELKTPLTLIRGYLEMMEDHRLPADELKNAEAIMIGEIDQLDKLVLDLLDLSRLESDAYELHQENFNSSELLNQITEKCSVVIRKQKINLCLKCEADPSDVRADRHGIEQVITNFLSNAIKNTPENGTIVVKSENEKDLIKISVFNEGSHINEIDLARIWDPFYRTDQSRARKTGGTGLGLTICREILEKHGCSYGAENIEGGVMFFFTLKNYYNLSK
ncbi:MAG: HAMP domain-containing sensor histidine kinase [Oscillospiraceae bacterium]|nr:HAMP domain-containing sensor histidine kinase [Oscillospiraceae bacterium]